jgi:hypothetical protein
MDLKSKGGAGFGTVQGNIMSAWMSNKDFKQSHLHWLLD